MGLVEYDGALVTPLAAWCFDDERHRHRRHVCPMSLRAWLELWEPYINDSDGLKLIYRVITARYAPGSTDLIGRQDVTEDAIRCLCDVRDGDRPCVCTIRTEDDVCEDCAHGRHQFRWSTKKKS